jgi:ribosomal protein S13
MKQLNEVRQFQKLAGLLKENEADQVVNKVEGSVEAKLDQLTPQQIQQLQADLAKMGITADTSVEDAAQKIEGSLDEAEGDDRKKLANALSAIGTGLIGSLLVPFIPLAIGHSTGMGTAGGYAVTFAAGGLLVGLAKALQHKSSSKMEDWHPDDPAGVDLDDMEEEDPEDFDDVSEDADAMNVSEAGDVKSITIEVPSDSYAPDFGKAVAKELVHSYGAREAKSFMEAFVAEIKKFSGSGH